MLSKILFQGLNRGAVAILIDNIFQALGKLNGVLIAIRRVFGSRVPVLSSTKSMTGHGLGAAGAQEAVFCLLMMQEGFVAPSINLEDPEPAIADLHVPRTVERRAIQTILSNSLGFGGHNASLVFKSFQQ